MKVTIDGVDYAPATEHEPDETVLQALDARLLVEAPEMYDLLNNLRYCLGKELLKDTVGYNFTRRLYAMLQRVEGAANETT